MLKEVFSDETMSRTRTYEWYRRFKYGQILTGNNPRSGRPPSLTDDDSIEQVWAVILSNPQLKSVGGGRWMWNISEVMSYHFNWKVRHASRHSRICSMAADWRAEFSHKNGDYSHSTITLLARSSTCRLLLFPKLKSTLKVWRCDTTEEIKENSLRDL
jgi:hypothetical protein